MKPVFSAHPVDGRPVLRSHEDFAEAVYSSLLVHSPAVAITELYKRIATEFVFHPVLDGEYATYGLTKEPKWHTYIRHGVRVLRAEGVIAPSRLTGRGFLRLAQPLSA